MANVIMDSYKVLALTSGLDLSSLEIRIILGDAADITFSSAFDFLDDIDGGTGVVAESNALDSKTTTAGTFDAADETWGTVSGDVSEQIWGFYETGTSSTSSLIFFFDTSVTGLPVTPNGGDITCAWNGSGIFSI